MSTPILVTRFVKERWSDTRRLMHELTPGGQIDRPLTEYYNAITSARRLKDAYEGARKWRVSNKKTHIEITRIL